MINKNFESFINKMQSIKLSSDEKADILARSLSVIDTIEAATAFPQKKALTGAWNSYIFSNKFVSSMAVVLLLVLTGGTSLAAESALPGDPLYAMKININEELKSLTAVTPEAKAELAVEQTSQRLQEAATLSARGQLTDASKQILQTQLQIHDDNVKNQVASLIASNNISAAQEIAGNYESSLKANETILEQISTDKSDDDVAHLNSLIATVQGEIATTTVASDDLNTQEVASDSNSPDKVTLKLQQVQSLIKEVIDLQTASQPLSTTTNAFVLTNVDSAQVLSIKATGYIASSSYSDALTSLQQATQNLSDAESSIEAETSASTDVKSAIGISTGIDTDISTSTATTTVSTTISANASTTQSASIGSTTATSTATTSGTNYFNY